LLLELAPESDVVIYFGGGIQKRSTDDAAPEIFYQIFLYAI
jgi:hypothetical protein